MPSFQNIKKTVEKEGLIYIGVTSLLKPIEDFNLFKEWLALEFHGEMKYLENNLFCRENPAHLFPNAKSAIVFGLPYFHDNNTSTGGESKIAQFAQMRDYHQVLKEKGKKVIRCLKLDSPEFESRVYVDSAPILERSLALLVSNNFDCFIGKNKCYYHPEYGSFLLLAEVITSKEFLNNMDINSKNNSLSNPSSPCNSCDLCVKSCPMNALEHGYLNSKKCVSYWTCEAKNTVPIEYWKGFSNFFVGCDVCQLVCPINKKLFIQNRHQSANITNKISICDAATISKDSFRNIFSNTVIFRIGRERLIRNALIAMKVANHEKLNEAIEKNKNEESSIIKETICQIYDYSG